MRHDQLTDAPDQFTHLTDLGESEAAMEEVLGRPGRPEATPSAEDGRMSVDLSTSFVKPNWITKTADEIRRLGPPDPSRQYRFMEVWRRAHSTRSTGLA